MSAEPRSTRELFAEDQDDFAAKLAHARWLFEEGAPLVAMWWRHSRTYADLIATGESLTDAQMADYQVCRERFAEGARLLWPCVEVFTWMKRMDERHMPAPLWRLVSKETKDDELQDAANHFARETTLIRVVYEARWWELIAGMELLPSEERGVIAQAALFASREARSEQDFVEFDVVEVDGVPTRRQYRLSYGGGRIVPIRDLPTESFARWMKGRIRKYVLDELVPDWRERESLAAVHGAVVSLDAPVGDDPGKTLGDSLAAVPPADAEAEHRAAVDWAEVEQRLRPETAALVALRSRGMTIERAAAIVGLNPPAARQRLSRANRQLRRLLQHDHRRRTSHPPGGK